MLFSTSCKAHGTRLFTLVHQRAKPPKRSIEIREHADRYDVATALVNFSVRKTGFSVIENVRRKGRLLVPPHDKGLFVRVGTELYQARLDPGVTVTIQEQGPLHAVFRAEGSFRNASGKRCFDFVCFLACFAQSPVVRLSLTLLNRQGKYDEGLPLSGFFLQLPTTLSEGTVIVAGSEGAKKARLAAQNEAFLYQKDSERGFFGGGNTCAAMSYLYRHTKDTRYLQSALRQLPTRSRFSNPWKDFALTMRNAALCAGDLHHVALKEQERKKR